MALDRVELRGRLEQLLATVNGELPPWERIARILVGADEWTIDNALLTPTLKLRRKAIEIRFRDWATRAVQDPAPVSFESA